MAEEQEEEPWVPDPNKPHILQDGRNSTHLFPRESVRTTTLSVADMKYLRTYKNTSTEAPDHVIDSRDEKLLTFLKLNYFEPTVDVTVKPPLILAERTNGSFGGVRGAAPL